MDTQMVERRAKKRPANGWHRVESYPHTYRESFHGHWLYITRDKLSKDGGWYKWIDGHFRGHSETLKVAKTTLEAEAIGERSAWESHK